ncbi:hypothetical protein Salat_1264500 [Sesamum alatum]|uniref:Uncharacterized protein n=1 Tax=Sesamum alatum TaxID=300844 RepID=A0AAE1YGB1_9LAMI|nr:hypothetical protein Salat_1264500 [Sesamum alatum]
MCEQRKRKRDNVIYIDEEDDCDCDGDGESDPQFVHFLSRLKEDDKSYVLESENNGVPAFIKYEVRSDSEHEQEHENQRKMRRSNVHKALRKWKGKDVVEDKKDKVQGQKEFIEVLKKAKVVGGNNILPVQKTTFGNYTAKNQLDHNVKAPLDKKMKEDDMHDTGGPSAFDEFRKLVLNILKKPYDKDEYGKLCEAVQVESYFEYYSGKLKIL